MFNDSAEVDFNVTVTIRQSWKGVDSATLQVGGVEHMDGCKTDGYKAYVGINGGDNGIGTETGSDKKYHDLKASCPGAASLQPGQTYKLRMLKKNVGQNVQLNTWVNGKPHCSVIDTTYRFLTRKQITNDCPAIDQLRIDGWPDSTTKTVGGVSAVTP